MSPPKPVAVFTLSLYNKNPGNNPPMQKLLALLVSLTLVVASARAAEKTDGFAFKETPGQSLDILYQGKIVGRYMFAHDDSTPEKRYDTYKPFLHIFDAAGDAPITKGAGGLFQHHRALFIGWDKIVVNGYIYDLWHMKDGDQIHQKFLAEKA